jgi:hypothetical protein
MSRGTGEMPRVIIPIPSAGGGVVESLLHPLESMMKVIQQVKQRTTSSRKDRPAKVAARDVDEKLTAFCFLKDINNDPNLFNTESGVLVHVSSTSSSLLDNRYSS